MAIHVIVHKKPNGKLVARAFESWRQSDKFMRTRGGERVSYPYMDIHNSDDWEHLVEIYGEQNLT